jgi:hypothetical protein
MTKFETRRRYMLSMFFATLNSQPINSTFFSGLLIDLMIEQLIWSDILDPEEFYGNDANQYMDFIKR